MSITTVSSRPVARTTALTVAGGLLVGAVLVALSPAAGVVRPGDGGAVGVSAGAVWWTLLPAVVAVLVALRSPIAGVFAVAGAGLPAIARAIADLDALGDPENAIRPELFHETSAFSLPFGLGPGALLLVAGDLMMIAAGVLAAALLARRLFLAESEIFGATARLPGPYDAAADPAGADPASSGRNTPLILLAALGLVGVLIGSAVIPYSGGFLDLRRLPASLGLWGLVAALVLVAVGLAAVLIAAALPRGLTLPLLGGVAAASAVGPLTALTAAGSADLSIGAGPWIGLVGALLIVGAGALAARGTVAVTDAPAADDPGRPSWFTRLLPGVLLLLAALAAWFASSTSGLYLDGAPDPVGVTLDPVFTASAPIPPPFRLAALLFAVAGVAALLPRVGPVGRAAASVLWAVPAFGVAAGLVVYSELETSASAFVPTPAITEAYGIEAHSWSLGPGMWWGLAAVVLGLAAAVTATVVLRSDADTAEQWPADEPAGALRRRALVPGLVLMALVVLSGLLPAYRSGLRDSPTLLSGYGVDSVGVWILTLAAVGAVFAMTRSARPEAVLGCGLGAAAVLTVRLVVPAPAAAEAFATAAGTFAVIVVAVLVVVAAAVLAVLAGRIPAVAPTRIPGERPGPASGKASGRSAGKPKGKAPGSTGTSGRGRGRPAARKSPGRPAGR
ncbi:hypothetical protein GIS00_10040 [Nakamurella sp. YIM 132087]|uniref:Uncharacterized protein n=1 Tax=Nakamurella alba TaxID=2665158 RepID=A0A7K1FJH7_9ACTN|nr:hypothetical protein [Nakamurella alba]MTD14287.1 hypothetical protein [Nakamurella alba]